MRAVTGLLVEPSWGLPRSRRRMAADAGDKTGYGCKGCSGRSIPKNWDLEREGLATHVASRRHEQTRPRPQPPCSLTWFPAGLSVPPLATVIGSWEGCSFSSHHIALLLFGASMVKTPCVPHHVPVPMTRHHLPANEPLYLVRERPAGACLCKEVRVNHKDTSDSGCLRQGAPHYPPPQTPQGSVYPGDKKSSSMPTGEAPSPGPQKTHCALANHQAQSLSCPRYP